MLLAGTLERIRFRGAALEDNALGDPVERELLVYLPPSYASPASVARRYPVLFVLTGYASTHESLLNFKPWEPNFLERYERLIAQGCREAIVVLADCFTRLGGSQFIDSRGTGRYQSYLADDILSFVDQRYRTLAKREARAIVGKSSGGFGALAMGMDRPERFAVFGSHAGDAAFELSVRPRFVEVAPVYESHGGPAGFLAKLAAQPVAGPSGQREFHALEILAMACVYAPVEARGSAREQDVEARGSAREQGVEAREQGTRVAELGELPFDAYTATLLPEVWQRWLAHDPVVRLQKAPKLLKDARFVFLDAGKHDEYGLQFGARILAQCLNNSGVTAHHEEFPGGHMGTSHRYDVSLPKLLAALEDDSPTRAPLSARAPSGALRLSARAPEGAQAGPSSTCSGAEARPSTSCSGAEPRPSTAGSGADARPSSSCSGADARPSTAGSREGL
jgi:enterochelin esterase-like enzyme